MKIFTNILIFILLSCSLNAQQDPQYSHNMFNHNSINPGSVGSSDLLCLNAINRNQWLGFKGAPVNRVFSASAPFKLFEKSHGVGLAVQTNSLGLETDLGLRVSYAYQHKMKIGDGKLGVGLSLGFLNSGLDGSQFIGSDGQKPISMDIAVPTGKESPIAFDMGLGFFYTTEKLYMGISTTHPFTSKVEYTNSSGGESPYFIAPHYYLTAGYTYQLSNPLLELVPSFFLKSDGRTSDISFNTNLVYNNRIWGGLSYRFGQAFTALFGLELLSGVKFGVGYDYETSDLNFSNNINGSLEVVVSYCFKLKKEKIPQRYKSIRFL